MSDGPHEREQSYNLAMIGAGYAGIFALLSFTHGDLSAGERRVAALGLLVSLVVFVVWVVGGMIRDTLRNARPRGWAATVWALALVLTLGPAAIAAGAMFRAYWRIVVG